ncbi:hypothetical protein F5887DRAFT_1166089 [Amanita rubescens]|nr:hypothetical protein F5887DRAFT_1166089 [Amanita rubescens]
MAATVELRMLIDGIYQPALSIPVDKCQLFSLHPLTWLRYLGFTIYGTEGHISTAPGGQEVDYYQADMKPGIYYYVSQEPFLLDPDLMDDRTSDSSVLSTDRANFRQSVTDRDGTCLMTGSRHVISFLTQRESCGWEDHLQTLTNKGYAKEDSGDDDGEFKGFWELVRHVVTKYHVLIPFRAFPFRLL